jgi:ubiquinol oxidase
MPYFAYISMLHLYESLGWWRGGAELRRVHFAEEWNELHHLQIMESLGGDAAWADRALAAHASLFYYWACVGAYLFSPSTAYAFSELVEGHAVDTYTQFFEENEAALKALAPPRVALEYYRSADPYLFDALDTAPPPAAEGGKGFSAALPRRRPDCGSLYDVFVNVRDDEGEHVSTMAACRAAQIGPALAARKAAIAAIAAAGNGGDKAEGALPAPSATPAPTKERAADPEAAAGRRR